MASQRPPSRRTLANALVDGAIFVAFLLATAPHFTGIAIHEWLSLAFAGAIIVHLLLHWRWVVGVTVHFFQKAGNWSRLNYLLNLLLFIDITIVTFTGIIISEDIMILLGLAFTPDRVWDRLHHLSSDVAVLLVGLHVALHWRWIANTTGRILRAGRAPSRVQPEPVLPATTREVQ